MKLRVVTLLMGLMPLAQAKWIDVGYDHNGNVTELFENGKIVGQYEYDPYGNTTKIEGEAAPCDRKLAGQALRCKTRFSTKEYDETTGLYYYGYRHYDPKTGRWPSRDPIEEFGGINMYAMVDNNAVNQWDILGKRPPSPCDFDPHSRECFCTKYPERCAPDERPDYVPPPPPTFSYPCSNKTKADSSG